MNLSAHIDRLAASTPEKTAIRFEGEDITYAALAERIAAVAAVLHARLDVGRGDRVAYLGYNSPDLIALIFACAKLGAIVAPLNWRLTATEHRHMLDDCSPKAMFVEPSFFENIESIRDRMDVPLLVATAEAGDGWLDFALLLAGLEAGNGNDRFGATEDDALLLCYTSGATGWPKGVVLTQEAVRFNSENSVDMHDLGPEDHVLTTLPMFHVGGINIQTVPALLAGASVVLHRQFDPNATFDALAGDEITLTVLVPAQMQAMVGHPRWEEADFGPLRAVTTGSTFVPHALIQAFQERGVPVIQVYGSTETAPVAVYTKIADAHAMVGAAGKPGLHCDLRLIDGQGADVPPGTAGEVLIKGPNVMHGYWNQPEATAEALRGGWFHSGDMGHLDDDGYLHIDDRKKDMIISGGENIYPAELENVLADCPALVEASVVGRPDRRWGEAPVVIAVRAEGSSIDEAGVMALFDGVIARFKHPKAVYFVGQLPRNAMGKIVKDELRAMVRKEATAQQRMEARTGAGTGRSMVTIDRYFAPAGVAEAVEILAAGGVTVLAGGTDLMVAHRANGRGLGPGLMNISRLRELRGMRKDGGRVVLGALTTVTDLLKDAEMAAALPLLAETANRFASDQIRNAATVGGNVCNASPAGDLIVPLLLLDAEAELERWSGSGIETRRVPLADFFTGPGQTVRGPDELLTGLSFPQPPAGFTGGFRKTGPRPALEISIASVGVAGVVEGGTMSNPRVAFGAVAPVPMRGRQTEAVLDGSKLDAEVIARAGAVAGEEVSPISDVRASDWYRRHLVRVMTEEVLNNVANG